MPSKTFDEILNNASPEDKAAFDKTQALAPQGQEVTENPTAPTSVPNKTADATPVTGYNTDIHDAAAAKGNSATFSELSDKPATQEKQPPVQDQDKDR